MPITRRTFLAAAGGVALVPMVPLRASVRPRGKLTFLKCPMCFVGLAPDGALAVVGWTLSPGYAWLYKLFGSNSTSPRVAAGKKRAMADARRFWQEFGTQGKPHLYWRRDWRGFWVAAKHPGGEIVIWTRQFGPHDWRLLFLSEHGFRLTPESSLPFAMLAAEGQWVSEFHCGTKTTTPAGLRWESGRDRAMLYHADEHVGNVANDPAPGFAAWRYDVQWGTPFRVLGRQPTEHLARRAAEQAWLKTRDK